MTALTSTLPTLRVGAREYPVVLPSLRDPRLHLASVIVSIHVLGQVALGFHVSIPQILVAIGTCAVIEVALTLKRTGQLVWPASAMLTGSGVALIFRLIGTEHGDWWSTRGWYWFALVAGGSLLSKYLIRYDGGHLFNPSNFGLVIAFLLLGSSRAEPLDFWWAPLDGWMVAAYALILVGGIAITARLGMLGMAVGFWLTLFAAIGLLAASGHCITARWSFEPVCGTHFWWVIITSPEILVFLFFMITDPRTVPAGRIGRVAFGSAVALVCTLLIAPQTTEFGAKVALLGGLVIMCVFRPLFDRYLPKPGTDEDTAGWVAARFAGSGPRLLARGAALTAVVVVFGAGIVAAGTPAREPAREVQAVSLEELGVILPDLQVDVSALPVVTVDAQVADFDQELAGEGAQELAVTLAEILEVEAAALVDRDLDLLGAVDYGFRFDKLAAGLDGGETVVERYAFDSLHLVVVFPYGEQGGASPGLQAAATLDEVTYDADGNELERRELVCDAITFAFVSSGDGGWLLVDAGTYDGTPKRASQPCREI